MPGKQFALALLTPCTNCPLAEIACSPRRGERPDSGRCTVIGFPLEKRPPAKEDRDRDQPSGAATNSLRFVGETPPGGSCDGLPNACQTAHNDERLAKSCGGKVVACRPRYFLVRDSRHMRDSHLFCVLIIGSIYDGGNMDLPESHFSRGDGAASRQVAKYMRNKQLRAAAARSCGGPRRAQNFGGNRESERA